MKKHSHKTRMSTVAMTLVGFLVIAAALAAVLAGFRMVPVLTGSMTPAYEPGTLVVTRHVPVSSVAVGDVIAFRPPREFDSEGQRPIMHRVVRIDRVNGYLAATTRGDNNPAPDPWLLALDGLDVQEAVMEIPLVGRLTAPVVGGSAFIAVVSVAGIVLIAAALLTWPRTHRCRVC